MYMKLVTKVVRVVLGQDVVFCTSRQEFRRVNPYSRLHHQMVLADGSDLAAPCLQGPLATQLLEQVTCC